MENQGILQSHNGNSTLSARQMQVVHEQNRQAMVLREALGEAPAAALGQVLQLLTGEAVVEQGDELAQLNRAMCHYAIQARQELVAAQHELFVTRQRLAAEADKLESLSRLVDESRREKQELAAELEAYRSHLDELEVLLEEAL